MENFKGILLANVERTLKLIKHANVIATKIREMDLLWVGCKGVLHDKKVILSDYLIYHECHAVSSYIWLNNPHYHYVLGFAYENDNDIWYFHSFLINDEGVIIEPSPIVRQVYWGRVMSFAETRIHVCEELDNIRNLGLEVTDKMLEVLLG